MFLWISLKSPILLGVINKILDKKLIIYFWLVLFKKKKIKLLDLCFFKKTLLTRRFDIRRQWRISKVFFLYFLHKIFLYVLWFFKKMKKTYTFLQRYVFSQTTFLRKVLETIICYESVLEFNFEYFGILIKLVTIFFVNIETTCHQQNFFFEFSYLFELKFKMSSFERNANSFAWNRCLRTSAITFYLKSTNVNRKILALLLFFCCWKLN